MICMTPAHSSSSPLQNTLLGGEFLLEQRGLVGLPPPKDVSHVHVLRSQATQWHHIPNNWQAPSPRSGHAMAWSSAAGGLYVFGGSDDIGGSVAAKCKLERGPTVWWWSVSLKN